MTELCHELSEECEVCNTFVCASCNTRVDWETGGDCMSGSDCDFCPWVCSDCWVKHEAERCAHATSEGTAA